MLRIRQLIKIREYPEGFARDRYREREFLYSFLRLYIRSANGKCGSSEKAAVLHEETTFQKSFNSLSFSISLIPHLSASSYFFLMENSTKCPLSLSFSFSLTGVEKEVHDLRTDRIKWGNLARDGYLRKYKNEGMWRERGTRRKEKVRGYINLAAAVAASSLGGISFKRRGNINSIDRIKVPCSISRIVRSRYRMEPVARGRIAPV